LIWLKVATRASCYGSRVRTSLQDLIRLLAQYRRRLDSGENANPAELLQALIAEIESERGEAELLKSKSAGRGC
jgi:hypothetical protein